MQFPWARKEPVDLAEAIPLLGRMIRNYHGGNVIGIDEYECWKCGYWLFATEDGIPYCVWCGHSHRPPTREYRAALYFAIVTEEGTLLIV